jgi:amino acid adenylation domain-containing protein
MATQVVSRLREKLKVAVPLRSLFDEPTVAGMAAIIERAIEAKTKDEKETTPAPIKSVPRNQGLPLSFAQQRLWFLDQLEPGSSFYNVAAAVRLDGLLNIAALNAAFDEIIRRHESLRTTFSDSAGAPQQVIAPEVKLTLPVFDLGSLPASEREAEASRRAAEEAQRPFDLSIGPLMRARLVRLAEHQHILLLTMHHIISDGWSMRVLVKEVAALYEAFAADKPSPLPQPSIQYADYAAWQREWLRGALLEKQIDYWKRRLDGAATLELPADRPRPPVQTYAGARYDFELPEGLSRRLKALGQRTGATLFMTLMAAFQTLLHRYTGQEDICVGTPIAGRTRLDTESLIGFFVNTLVLRTTVSRTSTFQQVLARVREATLEANAHQDLPFDRLVEILQPAREMSRTPFVQVLFALQDAVLEKVQLSELKLSPVKAEKTTAKVDLTLLMEETANGLKASFEFNTDLFDAATIERMAGHFRQLLEAASNDPEARVSQLPLMTAVELHQLLDEWNETTTDYPRDKCVHELFELQVERTPHAIAVIGGNHQLTFRELNERANQVSHYLQSSGAGLESPIGIMIERSVEMVVGLLGILKAGGAYVPLDPEYPRERLAFMLEDAGVRHLLTHEHLLPQLPEQHGARLICIDSDWPAISQERTRNATSAATPENLAYVIYTSGSTGVPKGVSVDHRSVVRLVQQTNYVELNAAHTFLQMAPVSFDASTFEIWGSLLNGARLALMAPGATSLEELGESLRRYQVTTLWLTAGLFHLMVDQQLANLTPVKQLLAGGDVLSVPHVKRFLRNAGGGKLINGYGPTENTTFTCCHSMTDAARIGVSVPIGRPIANTKVYVLDGDLRPVPIGVAGELYTSGDGLARSYLNRPELTAEKFIPCPFGDQPGARLYRTGDRVRWLPGGEIEFLGRHDHQVKLRGFRVELEEIEATLRRQPAVRDAVVVVREESDGDKRLVAYVALDSEALLTATDLRRCLKDELPEYMVPQAFVLMEEFPLTPNGKIDRRALPAPYAAQAGGSETYVAPQTDTEKSVTGIWTNVLGLEPIGVNDNFFELGGHSLQATRVVSQLREAFQMELPLRSFFEAPTVAGVAALIEQSRRSNEADHLPLIARCSREGDLPLSFAQERLWFLDQLQPSNSLYNIPVGLFLTGELDTGTLERTLNEIIRRHESLRTTFTQSEGAPKQVIAHELKLRLPVVDLTSLPAADRESEANLRAKEEAQRPFDLSAGPLLRATLLRLADDEHILLLTMHHIISDGWSMGVLVKEVATLYDAFAAGQPSPLAEPAIQYADYAVWQRDWLQGAVLEKLLEYWKRQLNGARILQLPADRKRPATPMYHGARCTFELPEEVSRGIKVLAQREGATLFMVLLAAFQTLLRHYTGQDDVSVGTDIANRKRLEIENVIGFFINQLVLRTDLSGDPAFAEVVKRVRDVTLEAYAHQDLPFDRLVDALKVERSLQSSPLFQIKFVMQNAPIPQFELQNFTVTLLNVSADTSKFDLTLTLWEEAETIKGWFEYNSDLFDAATIMRLGHTYATLLTTVAARPEITLHDLKPILAEADREHQAKQEQENKYAFAQRFKSTQRKAVAVFPVEV